MGGQIHQVRIVPEGCPACGQDDHVRRGGLGVMAGPESLASALSAGASDNKIMGNAKNQDKKGIPQRLINTGNQLECGRPHR